jgi:hypothetical protein
MARLATYRSFTCTATQQEILPENPNRKYALLVNDGDADIYLGFAQPAVVNQGVRLNANGGSFEITLTNPFYGRIYAVGDATGPKLLATEW